MNKLTTALTAAYVSLTSLGGIPPAAAQAQPAKQEAAKAVGTAAAPATIAELTPWIDNRVIAAGVLDVEHIDIAKVIPEPEEIAKLLVGFPELPKEDLAEMGKMLGEARVNAMQWQADFLAAGGQKAFIIIRMAKASPEPSIIIPLRDKGDTAEMKELLAKLEIPAEMMRERDGVLIFGKDPLKGLPLKEPSERAAGYEAAAAVLAPDHPVFASYIIPTPDQLAIGQMGFRQAMSQFKPVLTEKGLAVPTGIEQKVEWAATAVSAPALNMRLIVKMVDDAAAKELADFGNKMLSAVPVEEMPDSPFKEAIKGLKFIAAKDIVDFRLDGPAFSAGSIGIVLPALGKARNAAKQAVTMSNAKQICMGVMTYSADNKDKFPPNLAALAEYGINEKVRTNPTGSTWVYTVPAKSLAHVQFPDTTLLVHESFTDWPRGGIVVGYVDGHIAVVKDRAAFDKLKEKKQK